MCFIEYDWITGLYRFRIGDRFADFQGVSSMRSLRAWQVYLRRQGITLEKTDSRTWRLVHPDQLT